LPLLQAYADDSASEVGDKRLFIAGYLNRADRWTHFCDAWNKELSAAPDIQYLKMAEANHLSGQFTGWTIKARQEKLLGFVRVIQHFKPQSFEFSVSRDHYFKLVKPNAPRGISNPHFPCVLSVVMGLAQFCAENKHPTPVEFIFDKQDEVEAEFRLFFSHMIKDLPVKARRLISGAPRFECDREIVPLQAADMLAWHLRRHHEGHAKEEPLLGLMTTREGHLVGDIGEGVLRSWGEKFRGMPVVSQLKGRRQWREVKAEIIRLSELGYVPPHGTKWKNFVHEFRHWLAGRS